MSSTHPNNKALLVGIKEYDKIPLHCCWNDTAALESLLSRHEDNTPNFAIQKEDHVATKGRLRQLLETFFKGDADVALFYYSGHGYIDALGGYLVTPDYCNYDWGVSLQDVLAIANKSKCRDRIIILDSCYSGSMGNISTFEQNTSVIEEGVTILTASGREETAVEANGHGIFTSLLLEALQGGAADVLGHISIGSIYNFIDNALGPLEQRPCFKTNVTHFTSLRNVKPRVPLGTIRHITSYFKSPDEMLKLDPSFEPTNAPNVEHKVVTPYANERNTKKFAALQKLVKIGLVVPEGAEHMYFAAMEGKACKLTTLGQHYWKLIKDGKL